ncbi:hypothetical protein ACSLNV_27600, partial [Escherichia coli]
RRALMLGMIADGTGYILLAFATRGWMAFPIMVLLVIGSIWLGQRSNRTPRARIACRKSP